MRSVLEEFACGNVNPEPRFFKRDSHYGRTMKKLVDSEEKLRAVLNVEAMAIFNEFIDAQADIGCLAGVDRFIYGYRLGVLMTMEVFEGKDDLAVGGDAR